MRLRDGVAAAFAAAALLATGAGAASIGAAAQRQTDATVGRANDRPATEQEEHFCQESTYRGEPPRSGDCSRVPLDAVLYEDDVYGRWDCRTMGNRQCGSTLWFDIAGALQGFDINDPHRPGCFVEPSNTPEGFEVIFRPDISVGDDLGFEVRCPS